jgi:hypothetical protein
MCAFTPTTARSATMASRSIHAPWLIWRPALHLGTGVDVGGRVDERGRIRLRGRGHQATAVHVLAVTTQDSGFVFELDVTDSHVLLLPTWWLHVRTLVQHPG